MKTGITPAEKDRRSGITLRELEVLQALVDVGTAINAARRLGISQSAVSRRLSQLEDRLGFQLFMRSGGRLVPTVEALSINEQLTPVFDTLARIANHADQPEQAYSGVLSIVAPPTIAHRFLPGRIAVFKKQNPDLQITFDVLASDSLMTGIAEDRFDIALSDSNVAHEGIRSELLLKTQAICVLPRHHHLASFDVIRPEDLHEEAFIALSRRHSSRAAIDRIFDRAGLRLNIVIEASTNVSVTEFVREGLGVSLLNPFPLSHQMGDRIIVRPFLPAIDYVTNFLLPSSRAPSSATLAFMQAMRSGLEHVS
ncbi:LysR substrate-binding domain-containing protein [Qingshengfaniella alkalisoli]|uniref:LysR family transcriptional regulator n=1 Tax=Qingshengfaniella alkalisoli TaxID=2599296 RepID=A0A5B8IYP0_9RHOB|nr:LysR substrate-binding domain-containing protein [Qingshengfaniella alkalisoli]QDY70834.1 LysR family transcriptional regulator [Qingshengfaniella alkalisoli]